MNFPNYVCTRFLSKNQNIFGGNLEVLEELRCQQKTGAQKNEY
jgi:hypothetical protein